MHQRAAKVGHLSATYYCVDATPTNPTLVRLACLLLLLLRLRCFVHKAPRRQLFPAAEAAASRFAGFLPLFFHLLCAFLHNYVCFWTGECLFSLFDKRSVCLWSTRLWYMLGRSLVASFLPCYYILFKQTQRESRSKIVVELLEKQLVPSFCFQCLVGIWSCKSLQGQTQRMESQPSVNWKKSQSQPRVQSIKLTGVLLCVPVIPREPSTNSLSHCHADVSCMANLSFNATFYVLYFNLGGVAVKRPINSPKNDDNYEEGIS